MKYGAWDWAWNAGNRDEALDLDTHDLRHFYASALISGGASIKHVHAHLWPGDDDRTRSVMDNALARLADRVRTDEVV